MPWTVSYPVLCVSMQLLGSQRGKPTKIKSLEKFICVPSTQLSFEPLSLSMPNKAHPVRGLYICHRLLCRHAGSWTLLQMYFSLIDFFWLWAYTHILSICTSFLPHIEKDYKSTLIKFKPYKAHIILSSPNLEFIVPTVKNYWVHVSIFHNKVMVKICFHFNINSLINFVIIYIVYLSQNLFQRFISYDWNENIIISTFYV